MGLCGRVFEDLFYNRVAEPTLKVIETKVTCPCGCKHEFIVKTPVEQRGTRLDFEKPPGGGLSKLCPWPK
jgi:hypothetical protein